jgi:hypothetical protein
MKYAVTGVIMLIFFIFIRTAPPTIYMGDSGEVVSAAYTLGIGHPPGYPLYMLCAKTFSAIPAGDIAFRLNIFSALLSAAAFLLFVMAAREFIVFINKGAAVKNDRRLAALMAAALLIFSGAFWFQGINAKGGIYILTVAVIMASILATLQYFNSGKIKFMYLAFYSVGFMVPAHPSAALLSFFIAAVLIFAGFKKGIKYRQAAAAACLYLAALATPYAYLFIRAGGAPLVNWAGLSGAGDVIGHILRKSYELHGSQPQAVVLLFRLKGYMTQLAVNYGAALLVFFYGMFLLYRAGKWMFFAAAAFIILNTAAIIYAIDTQAGFSGIAQLPMSVYLSRGFYLTNEIIPALIAALGFYGLFRAAAQKLPGTRVYIMSLTAAVPCVMLCLNFAANDQSMKFFGYDHAMNIMKTLGKDDRLFSRGDCPSFNIAYLKYAKKLFAETKVYDRNLALLDRSVYKEIPGPRVDAEIRTINDYPGKVFYTESFAYKGSGILSAPHGILFKPVKGAALEDGSEKYFSMYTFRDYFRDKNLDIFYRDYIARYMTGKAAYAAGKNDKTACLMYLSLADSIGGTSVITLIDIVNVSYSVLSDKGTSIFYLKKLCDLNPYDVETLDVLMDLYVNYDSKEAFGWISRHYAGIPEIKGKAEIKKQMDALRQDVKGM